MRRWRPAWLLTLMTASVALPGAAQSAAGFERTISTPRGGVWYAVTMRIPRPGLTYGAEANAETPPDATYTACVHMQEDPYRRFGMALWRYDPGNPERGTTFVSARSDPSIAPIETGTEPDRWISTNPRCRSAATSSEALVQTKLFFLAADRPLIRPRIMFFADPGIRILAESWGTSVRGFRETDFVGGQQASVRAEDSDPIDAFPNEVHPQDASGAAATAGVMRALPITYRRAAGAFVVAGNLNPTGDVVGYGKNAWMSIEGPGNPPHTFSIPDVVDGTNDRQWIGTNYFAGEPAGDWVYRLNAHLGGEEAIYGQTPAGGNGAYLFLMSMEADFPPCSTGRLVRRAADGHKICR